MLHDDTRIACAAPFSCFQVQPLDHTVKVAIQIFNAAFPGCQAVFLFDNASKHSTYAADALRVENMNLHPEANKACYGKALCIIRDDHSQCNFYETITTLS